LNTGAPITPAPPGESPVIPGWADGLERWLRFPIRRSTVREPYYIRSQKPPDADSDYWQTHITGPFIEMVHLGDSQRCGPETVKLLNLAYTAGTRNPECAETPVQRKTETGEV
jgi:hypothetical protein